MSKDNGGKCSNKGVRILKPLDVFNFLLNFRNNTLKSEGNTYMNNLSSAGGGRDTPPGKGVARGEGGTPPPPQTEKIVVEKWCYFRRLYF